MSLRETIEAAKQEAQQAGGIFSGKDEKTKTATKDGAKAEQSADGFSRRSAARAKPASAAASSVRVVSSEDIKRGRSGKNRNEMTKEERKAERAATRNRDDLAHTAAMYLMKQNEEYKHNQRIWWTLMITGMVLAAGCLAINALIRSGVGNAETLAYIEMVMIVMAYVSIIGAFIFDLWKQGAIRKQIHNEVKGLSNKRLEAIIREAEKAEAEAKAK